MQKLFMLVVCLALPGCVTGAILGERVAVEIKGGDPVEDARSWGWRCSATHRRT